VQTQGRLTTPNSFGQRSWCGANPDGSLLRIRDVAGSSSAPRVRTSKAASTGSRRSPIWHLPVSGANAIPDCCAGQANLERLSQRFPAGLKYLVNYDTTTFVNDRISATC